MRSDDFLSATATLRDLGGQHVWSLMVSLFGDLAQNKGDRIDGPILSAIMTAMSVRPEAVRVALYRLRNDGWIRSQKQGRISLHSLTERGRAESAAASPRIYISPQDMPVNWQAILVEENSPERHATLTQGGFVQIMPRFYLGDARITPPPDALVLHGNKVPDWLRRHMELSSVTAEYAALSNALRDSFKKLPPARDLSPIQVAALRCLVVHDWRRIVLKHPVLPKSLVSDDWPGLECHEQVIRLLSEYPRPSIREIAAT